MGRLDPQQRVSPAAGLSPPCLGPPARGAGVRTALPWGLLPGIPRAEAEAVVRRGVQGRDVLHQPVDARHCQCQLGLGPGCHSCLPAGLLLGLQAAPAGGRGAGQRLALQEGAAQEEGQHGGAGGLGGGGSGGGQGGCVVIIEAARVGSVVLGQAIQVAQGRQRLLGGGLGLGQALLLQVVKCLRQVPRVQRSLQRPLLAHVQAGCTGAGGDGSGCRLV